MQFCVIPPTKLLSRFKQRCHLCLAHKVLENEWYAKFFRDTEDYVILDNSAYELGTSLPWTEMLRAARYIEPREIVLPDILRNADATIAKVEEAFALGMPENVRVMAVPQGRNREEWSKCLAALLEKFGKQIDVIGVPVLCDSWPGTRLELLSCVPRALPIHLLGWDSQRYEVPIIAKEAFPNVRSVDSAKPIIMARGLNALVDVDFLRSRYRARPSDYFEWVWPEHCVEQAYADYNINRCRSLVAS